MLEERLELQHLTVVDVNAEIAEPFYHTAKQQLQQNAVIVDNLLCRMDSEPDIQIQQSDVPDVPMGFQVYNALYLNGGRLKDSYALLIDAIQHKNLPLVELLLRLPSSYSCIDPTIDNNRCFTLACRKGVLPIVNRLMEVCAPSANVLHLGFIEAITNGNYSVVERLLLVVDPSVNNNEAFIKSCIFRQLRIAKRLLLESSPSGARVDPTANYNKAFREATNRGHHDIVDILLREPRIDPLFGISPRDGRTGGIEMAIVNGHTKTVSRLLQDSRIHESAGFKNNLAYYFVRAECKHKGVDICKLLINYATIADKKYFIKYYPTFMTTYFPEITLDSLTR
jgi:hypothetical protein